MKASNFNANVNNQIQSLMLGPSQNKYHNNNNKYSSQIQIQKQKEKEKEKQSMALGVQSQIADEGHPFSEQLENLELQLQHQLEKENKEQLSKAHFIKPQFYSIPHNANHNHNLTLITKKRENIINSSQYTKFQSIKQGSFQIIIKKKYKITKIQQVKTYQMIAKMSRNQQTHKDINLTIRYNQPNNSYEHNNKKQILSLNLPKLNQFRDFPLPFKYELNGDNPLKEILTPGLNFSNKQTQNTKQKQKLQTHAQRLLIMQMRCKYLLNVPLNFNQAEYFLKLKVNLQKNCGLCLYYINRNNQKCRNFKYEIVKLMQNIIRIRCLILIDNKIEKIWKELQIPLVYDKNVHIPQNNEQSLSLLEVCINTKNYAHSMIKLNQFEISLNLQHPYEETSYLFIETDPNGVQIRQISLQSGKQFKQNEINIGGCEGQCKLI